MSPQPLLAHLDALYAFAQLLVSDAEDAAELVRATYARAFAHPGPLPDDPAACRAWLFQVLFEERRAEQSGLRPSAFSPEDLDEAPLPSDALDATRQRYAEALVARLLPSALVSLDETARLLLALVEVSGFTPMSAGELLGLDELTARTAFDHAHAQLARSLRFAAAPHEQPLLDRIVDTPAYDEALAAALQLDVEPAPPTLRAQIPVPEPPSGARLTEGQPARPFGPALFAALLVLGAGLVGYLATRSTAAEPKPLDAIAAAAADAPKATVLLRTDDPLAAERFAFDHVGWRVALPQIDGLPLAGVGTREVVPGVTVPVFLYEQGDERAALYGFDYRLLDQASTRLRLDPDVLEQIEDDRHYEMHDLGSARALLWRDRDDILVLVTTGDAHDLRARISRPAPETQDDVG